MTIKTPIFIWHKAIQSYRLSIIVRPCMYAAINASARLGHGLQIFYSATERDIKNTE